MEPEVYAIIGVYQIVCGISVVFSGWGLESILCREALYWKEKSLNERVKEYATQALLTRLVSGIIVIPTMAAYLAFINKSKYNGEYTLLFVCLAVGAVANFMIDSMRNMVRAEGGYVFVQLMSTLNATILKFFGIVLYFYFGATCYLYFYVLSSLPIFFCFLMKCKNNISLKYLHIKPMFRKVYEARYLWMKGELEYVRSNVDGLLVSLLFPSSIMGTYTIYKSLEEIMKGFIEGFFDVLSQSTVQYKGNFSVLLIQEKKIKMARNACITAILAGISIYGLRMRWWVSLLNLSNYDGIEWFVLCVAVGGILYLCGKYEINAIAFLAETKDSFVMAVINAVIAIASYIMVLAAPNSATIISQRLLNYLSASVIAIIYFTRKREKIYMGINQ